MFVFLYADSGCGCIVFAFFLPIEKGGEAKWRCSAARNIGGLSGGRFGGFDKELSGLPYFVTNRRLVARVNGYLQQVAYTPGEIVKKGQLLFVIEPSQYEDAVEQAEAALKTAQAQYDYAENNYTRMKEAAQSDAISTIDLIQAESKLEQSRACLLYTSPSPRDTR